jgi:hypothetical protein
VVGGRVLVVVVVVVVATVLVLLINQLCYNRSALNNHFTAASTSDLPLHQPSSL